MHKEDIGTDVKYLFNIILNKQMSSGFDMEGTQPLQLRRGSDANQRRSLLAKYNHDLNESADDTEYNNNQREGNERTGHNTETSMARLDEEIKTGRSKKVIYIGIGAIAALIILTIILIVALKGKSDPKKPDKKVVDYIFNPYFLSQDQQQTQFSSRYYNLGFDKQLLKKGNLSVKYYQQNFSDCQPIYNATLKTSMSSNFRTMRVQIQDPKQYKVADVWLNPSFTDHQFKDYLNHNDMNALFNVQINKDQSARPALNQSVFHISASQPKDAFYKDTEEFLTTKNQELFIMDRYQHISFEIKSKRFMGWGERASDKLFMDDGNYTIFPQAGDQRVDNGTSQQGQSAGAHPFLVFQITDTNNWAGMFLFNSNPMSLELNKTGTQVNSNKTWSRVTIRTTGGALDFFIFYGPSYTDVIKQYQEITGKPKMLPSWAQRGLFASSPAYGDSYLAIEAVKAFKSSQINVNGLVLPLSYEISYFSGNSRAIVDEIRKAYPSPSTLQLILPFTTFVSNSSQFQWVKKFNEGFDNKSFAVTIEGQKLEVQIVNEETGVTLPGFCMDVFNPRFVDEFLEPELLRNMREPLQGYWLKDNTPVIKNYLNQINNPLNIPYRPGKAFDSATLKTLPETAVHEMGNGLKTEHFFLHSLFGSKIATQFIENLYPQKVLGQRSFVLSDSTFAGLGRTGVAHLLPAQEPSYPDLVRQLNGLISMNLFGIPNTGVQLCNTIKKNPALERLCAQYFSLSVISPLAMYVDKNSTSLDGHVFNFTDPQVRLAIVEAGWMRQRVNMYSREQLSRIETFGGALIRPAFTEFKSLSNNLTDSQIDFTTVTFGDSILASYLFYDINTTKTIQLPKENNWVQLYKKTQYGLIKYQLQAGEKFTFEHTKDEVVGVQLFQKAGTVVVLQQPDDSNENRRRPIHLSVALRNDTINNIPRARGFVYIEGATNTFLDSEYHEVYAENNIISFKQQDIYSQAQNSTETQISNISVAFSPIKGVNFACSIDKDLRTIKQLYVYQQSDPKEPFIIIPIKPDSERKVDDPYINIDEVGHVIYGHVADTSQTCEKIMTGYKMIGNTTSSDGLQYGVVLRPNIMDMMPEMVSYQRLDILITGNNSLALKIQDINYPVLSPLLSNEMPKNLRAQDISLNITNILDEYFEPNYCFALRLPNDVPFQQDFFSTCDGKNKNASHFQLHHLNMGIFNFDLTNTKAKQVSGLGERKGSFFLENGTTYAFYNNDNNVEDSYQAHGRRVVHGRNGFHNAIFAQHATSKNSLAVVFGTYEGREVTFTVRDDQEPCFAVQSSVKEVILQIYFDLKTEDLARAVFKPVLQKQGSGKIPPAWAFGHHMTVPSNMNQKLNKTLSDIIDDLKFPLEGIIQTTQNLDQSRNSMSFDPLVFNADAVKDILKRDLSLVSINTPTYPIAGRLPNDPNIGPIFNQNISLSLNNRPYLDYSRGGRICYLNNFLLQTSEVYISVMNKFIEDNNLNKFKFGLYNYQNEISRPMCSMDSCWEANFDVEMDPLSYKPRKPGNWLMTQDTLDDVSSFFQKETQQHNLQGESMNMLFQQKGVPNFLIADSTALGSTIRGQVARVFDYFTSDDMGLPLALQQMQAFSFQFGIPMVSVRFPRRPSLDIKSVMREMLLNTYSTSVSINQHYVDLKSSKDVDPQAFRKILRIKYTLMAYTRTQVFNRMNTGTPVIRPMFLSDFDSVALASDTINNMYMFGPAILAQTDFMYSNKKYPFSNWCSVHGGISNYTICFNNQVDAKFDDQQMVIIKQGSITPLYSYNYTSILNGTDYFLGSESIKNLTLDLHLFNDAFANGTSKGSLLMDDGLGTIDVSSKWCYIEFEMIRENFTIVFRDMSQEQGQISQYNCSEMKSYQMNLITIYGFANFTDSIGNPMAQATITLKSNATMALDLIEVEPKEAVGVFQVRGSPTQLINTVNYFDLDSIKFSSELPAPPSVASMKK